MVHAGTCKWMVCWPWAGMRQSQQHAPQGCRVICPPMARLRGCSVWVCGGVAHAATCKRMAGPGRWVSMQQPCKPSGRRVTCPPCSRGGRQSSPPRASSPQANLLACATQHGASCGVQLREGRSAGGEEAGTQANVMAKHTVGALLALVRRRRPVGGSVTRS